MQSAIDWADKKDLNQYWSRTRKIIQCSHSPSWASQCHFLGYNRKSTGSQKMNKSRDNLDSPFLPKGHLALHFHLFGWLTLLACWLLATSCPVSCSSVGDAVPAGVWALWPTAVSSAPVPRQVHGRLWIRDKWWLEGAAFSWTCSPAETMGTSALLWASCSSSRQEICYVPLTGSIRWPS